MSAGDRPSGQGGRPSESFPLEARRLKDHEWPANDLAARGRALHKSGSLSPPGPAVSWAPATKEKRWGEWGRNLAFLAANDDLNPAETTAGRLNVNRVGHYLVALRARQRPSIVRCEIVDLSYAVAALVSDRSWAWVRRHPGLPAWAEVGVSHKLIVTPDPMQLLATMLDEGDRDHGNRYS